MDETVDKDTHRWTTVCEPVRTNPTQAFELCNVLIILWLFLVLSTLCGRHHNHSNNLNSKNLDLRMSRRVSA